MTVNNKIKLFTLPSDFKMVKPGRPNLDNQTAAEEKAAQIALTAGLETDLEGASLQLDWYQGPDQKTWIGKIPGEEFMDTVHEVAIGNLFRKAHIKAPPMTVSQVRAHDSSVKIYGLEEGRLYFSTMSKKIKDFQELGQEFADAFRSHPRPGPLTVKTKEHGTVPVQGFWRLAAFAKWYGDIDFLGVTGKNTGYQIKMENNLPVAKIVKIDPGSAAMSLNAFEKGKNNMDLADKDIYFDMRSGISFADLSEEEKKEFLTSIAEIVQLTDKQILSFVKDIVSIENIPEEFSSYKAIVEEEQETLFAYLVQRREELKKVYQEDLMRAGLIPAPSCVLI
ncbi:MAG: hypothetical protein Tsb0015_05630 [Simkaniaceae bacterium]